MEKPNKNPDEKDHMKNKEDSWLCQEKSKQEVLLHRVIPFVCAI